MVQNAVPYFSQYENTLPEEWRSRSCGIVALYMALRFITKDAVPEVPALIEEGVTIGAYVSGTGWKHDGLVALARTYGAQAHRSEFRSEDVYEEGIRELKNALERGNVPIVSLMSPESTDTHLVPLTGYDDSGFFYHEPAKKLAEQKVEHVFISNGEFKKRWRGLVIFVG